MNTNLVNIVKQIIANNGETALADPQRLKAFFGDLAKDEPKPLRVAFGRCIEEGAYNALKTAQDQSERAERKAAIAQRVHDEHGLDIALCNEALDILEAAVFDTTPAAYQQPLQQDQPQSPAQTTPASIYTEPSPVYAAPENAAASASTPAKKNTLRNVLIAAGALIAAGVCVYFAAVYRPVALNEYDQIIFTQIKNNDELVKGNFALTLRDVKATQKFITKNFPGFDFEEEGYVTDDYRNELLIKEFNTNPQVLAIYLYGVAGQAGKSQVYAKLWVFDDELLGYYFSIDQEFSDRSGFQYYSGYYPITSQYDGKITHIHLRKFLYTDINEPYWVIIWDDDVPVKSRRALLKDFLNSLRYTKVFKNFAMDFLKDVYTGIEKYQTIEDIVDWYN